MTRSTYIAAGRVREAVREATADRTSVRDVRAPVYSPRWGEVEVRVWPTRVAMARRIRADERAAPSSEWRPIVRLEVTEGY